VATYRIAILSLETPPKIPGDNPRYVCDVYEKPEDAVRGFFAHLAEEGFDWDDPKWKETALFVYMDGVNAGEEWLAEYQARGLVGSTMSPYGPLVSVTTRMRFPRGAELAVAMQHELWLHDQQRHIEDFAREHEQQAAEYARNIQLRDRYIFDRMSEANEKIAALEAEVESLKKRRATWEHLDTLDE
jgi:hypothetical protein